MKLIIKSLLSRIGYDVVRLPYPDSLGRHLQGLFRRKKINCVIDVGARVGEFGSFLRGTGYDGYIFSFEPVAVNFRQLKEASLNDPRWIVHNFALGSEPESKKINATKGSALSLFLKPNEYCSQQFGADSEVVSGEIVEVKRLDDLFASLTHEISEDARVYLKLDTQGWNEAVLEGTEAYLGQILAMQSEVSVKPIYDGLEPFTESIPRYMKYGFELSGMFPVKCDNRHSVIEFDCVMFRPNQ